jgi:hypothetical protein
VFDEKMDKFHGDLGRLKAPSTIDVSTHSLFLTAKVLPEYSLYRNPDAKAMCDLALYNYVEVQK